MQPTNIFAFIFGLCLATITGAPQREKRQIESNKIEDFGDFLAEIRKFHVKLIEDFGDFLAEIRKFHVNSKIQLR